MKPRDVQGRLLGVIPMRRRFEFETDGGAMIVEGKVGRGSVIVIWSELITSNSPGADGRLTLHRRIVTKSGGDRLNTIRCWILDEVEAHPSTKP